MSQTKRAFRSSESYAFEFKARDAVAPFLRSRGFVVRDDQRTTVGKGQSQTIMATLPDGSAAVIGVKLCWRKDGRAARENLYSAAQLRARTLDDGWGATLQDIVRRNQAKGITHLLFFQRNVSTETHVALVPIIELAAIWDKQRRVSDELIAQGRLGRTKKNHATNGNSPTIWLQDDRTDASRAVPDALWSWPGVMDLMALPLTVDSRVDDTFDDCPGLSEDLGSDGGLRIEVKRSAVRRDSRVRARVRQRADGKCERCGTSRDYSGFLDVHHIMGVERSDRPWTCVALCPNCHREAHCSSDADGLRDELTEFASRFRNA